ncbi:kinase-like protein [Setomelanomma holmii]|uniref:Kinase-like protein n=1 Tax=Setomelanomma holmii TaxID=210430 RepID=A0A9P4H1J2_9PLEO|nr:kinase-like protein [Setomelanomma holmii]
MARKRIFIKRVNAQATTGNKQAIRSEIENMRSLDHQHIVKVVSCYQEPSGPSSANFYVLLHPSADNDLQNFLEETCNKASSSDRELYISWINSWFQCLLSALAYLHYQGIHHEDIKPANIVHCSHQIYFTDFSSSRKVTSWEETSTESPAAASRLFAAPEALYDGTRRFRHGSETDVFSLGLVFVEMVTVMIGKNIDDLRSYLFDEANEPRQYHRVVHKIATWFWRQETPATRIFDKIVYYMLKQDRSKRFGAQETVDTLNQSGDLETLTGCECRFFRWERRQPEIEMTDDEDLVIVN